MRTASLLASLCVLAACTDEPKLDADVGEFDVGPDVVEDVETDAPADVTSPDSDTAESEELEFCEGATELRYDPWGSAELLLYPDNALTVPDETSPTGLRLSITEETPWIQQVPDLLREVSNDLNELSGFAANGAVLLRTSAPWGELPSGEFESVENGRILFVNLGVEPPRRIPFDAVLSDEGHDLFLEPLVTLDRGVLHAVIVTSDQKDTSGDCLAPSDVTRRTLAEPEEALHAEWRGALAQLNVPADSVSGMTTFTVHNDIGAVVDAAAAVQDETYAWTDPECTTTDDQIRCELTFDPWDFREGRYVETPTPQSRWQVDVTVWLPTNTDGPIPFVVYGHGINDRRQSGGSVARQLNPAGIAVVAADALAHGTHPTAAEDVSLAALDFLGIDLTAVLVDPLRLRGNFEQTVLDRLQLVELIRQNPDVTGDGVADLDIEHVGYWGISLGGMLGAPFAALSGDTDAAILSVAGGRLLTFATDTAQVAAFRPLIGNLVGSEELFLRLLPVAQTVVDAADPATYGAAILSGELHAGPGPSLLFPVATEDDTVPPATGRVLARAIGAPQLGHAFFDVETLELVSGPLESNIAPGQTAAYYQVDRVSVDGGSALATHGNAPLSAELGAQAREFFSTALFGEPAVIIDPLEEFDTPELP